MPELGGADREIDSCLCAGGVGFGTLDELFELLTLMQTVKMPRIPVVLVDKQYWNGIINFERLAEEQMISPGDLDLFGYADDAESAWTELLRLGLKAGPRPAGYPSLAPKTG